MNSNKTVVSIIAVIGLLLMQMVSMNIYRYKADAEKNHFQFRLIHIH